MPYRNQETGQEYGTMGEAWVGRDLRVEKRAGVDHYKIGQHHATIDPDQDDPNIKVATLTYASRLGVVIVPCVQVFDGEWEPALQFCRIVGLSMDYGPQPFPPALSEESVAALKEAERQQLADEVERRLNP